MMKYLLAAISLVLAIGTTIIAWNNPSATIALSIPIVKLTIFTNSFLYIIGILAIGFISGLLLGGAFTLNQKDKINPYKRQLEKLSVVKDSSQSRVEVLEAKIKTLEAALQKSLENK